VATRVIVLALVIEEKDEATNEGVQPFLPQGEQVAAETGEDLMYLTRNGAQFGYRVTHVEGAVRDGSAWRVPVHFGS
jgi:hypothetical protein